MGLFDLQITRPACQKTFCNNGDMRGISDMTPYRSQEGKGLSRLVLKVLFWALFTTSHIHPFAHTFMQHFFLSLVKLPHTPSHYSGFQYPAHFSMHTGGAGDQSTNFPRGGRPQLSILGSYGYIFCFLNKETKLFWVHVSVVFIQAVLPNMGTWMWAVLLISLRGGDMCASDSWLAVWNSSECSHALDWLHSSQPNWHANVSGQW